MSAAAGSGRSFGKTMRVIQDKGLLFKARQPALPGLVTPLSDHLLIRITPAQGLAGFADQAQRARKQRELRAMRPARQAAR